MRIFNPKRLIVRTFTLILLLALILPTHVINVSAAASTSMKAADYHTYLENRYGYKIIIDSAILKSKTFYEAPKVVTDMEYQILRDIDSALSFLPAEFVREANLFLESKGIAKPFIWVTTPSNLPKRASPDTSALFYCDTSNNTAGMYIISAGNKIIENILHEFGHEISFILDLKNALDSVEEFFKAHSDGLKYSTNINKYINANTNTKLPESFRNVFISLYSSISFSEEFSEIFSLSQTQYRYISSYGNGNSQQLHKKIAKVGDVLRANFKSLADSNIMKQAQIDPTSDSYKKNVTAAKQADIIPWKTAAINKQAFTKYDASILVRNLLYLTVPEAELYKLAGLKIGAAIPVTYAVDIADPEDIYLVDKLKVVTVDSTTKRFDGIAIISKDEAAKILTRAAEIIGIKLDVNYFATLHGQNSFVSSEKYASELYKLYSTAKSKKFIGTPYIQPLQNGTSIGSDGWMFFTTSLGDPLTSTKVSYCTFAEAV